MSGRRLGMLAVATWIALWQPAEAVTPEGTWLISARVAVQVFDCEGLFCGRIVWLRHSLRCEPGKCAAGRLFGV